jgi:hypothetical protein
MRYHAPTRSGGREWHKVSHSDSRTFTHARDVP